MKTLFRFSLTVEKKHKSFTFLSSRKRKINKLSSVNAKLEVFETGKQQTLSLFVHKVTKKHLPCSLNFSISVASALAWLQRMIRAALCRICWFLMTQRVKTPVSAFVSHECMNQRLTIILGLAEKHGGGLRVVWRIALQIQLCQHTHSHVVQLQIIL